MLKTIYVLCFLLALLSCESKVTSSNTRDSTNTESSANRPSNNSHSEDSSASHKPISEASNSLIGYWFIPHSAGINITFSNDSTFVFNDFNLKRGASEQLTGKFQLHGGTLILNYNDRPKQRFRFHKGEGADNNYYIEKGSYYFVKGEAPDSL